MQFLIQIQYARSIYPMTVALIKADRNFEFFKIFNPKSPDRFIVIRGNRPMLKARGLKKKPVDWRLVEGHIKNRSTYERTIEAINAHLGLAGDGFRGMRTW